MQRVLLRALLFALILFAHSPITPAQTPHTLTYAPGKQITLSLPDPFDINIAASGLKRVRFFAKAPDGRIFVTIGDNGAGIAPEDQGKIFETFFTTKPMGVGTGLGLGIAQRIAEQAGGVISFTSEPGKTEFTVSFPIKQESK